MAEELEQTWKEAAAKVLALLRRRGPSAAFTYLDELSAKLDLAGRAVPAGFREVAGLLYWQHKALPEFCILSEQTVHRLDAALRDAGQPVEELVRPLGGTCYNLAAFAWPGWDEPGITVGPAELAAGRRAADRCLEIRLDPAHAAVGFGYNPSMAHWVVGAYRLADREWDAARSRFEESARLNREAGAEDVLERGYLCLVDLLEHGARPEDEGTWAGILDELNSREGDEDAAVYRDQLLSARRVFER